MVNNSDDKSHIRQILTNIYHTVINIGNGVTQYTCWSRDWDGPLGFLWIRFRLNQENLLVGDILNCYTQEWARRHGIAKFLYNTAILTEGLKSLTSPSGTEKGGKEFLQSYGFIYNENAGLWIYSIN